MGVNKDVMFGNVFCFVSRTSCVYVHSSTTCICLVRPSCLWRFVLAILVINTWHMHMHILLTAGCGINSHNNHGAATFC